MAAAAALAPHCTRAAVPYIFIGSASATPIEYISPHMPNSVRSVSL